MKKIILLTVCALSLANAWATRTTREEATLAATHWLKTNFMARRYFADATATDGASTIGDGNIWTPPVTVKGGTSGFYSIKVSK